MKASAILVAGALAVSGGAFAQQYDSSKAPNGKSTATVKSSAAPKEGLGTKLKRGLHRMGDKTRQAFHRGDNRTEQARSGPDNDTRAMGAPGAARDNDNGRRTRMDSAYDNWKSKQKQ